MPYTLNFPRSFCRYSHGEDFNVCLSKPLARHMRSRRALVRSFEPCSQQLRVLRPLVPTSVDQVRSFSVTQKAQFSTSRSQKLAFGWFRRPTDNLEDRKRRWDTLLQRHRTRGELSVAQVNFLEESFDKLHSQIEVDELSNALQIVLRSSSLEHARFTKKLYDHINSLNSSANIAVHTLVGDNLPDLLRNLVKAGDGQSALNQCDQASKAHVQPLRLWRALLEAHHEELDLVGFTKVCNHMSMHSIQSDVHIINLQLDLLSRLRLFEDARLLYAIMGSQLNVNPDWQSRMTILDLCMNEQATAPEHAAILKDLGDTTYTRMESSDIKDHADEVWPKLLSWLVVTGSSIDSLHRTIAEMQQHGTPLNVDTINSLLFAATISNQWLMVDRIWTSLATPSMFPNNKTYSLRIAASVMAGDTRGARTIFESSSQSGFADMLDPLALQTLLIADFNQLEPDDKFCLDLLQLLERMEPFPINVLTRQFLIPKMIDRKHFARLEAIIASSRSRTDWNPKDTLTLILQQISSAKDSKKVWNITILLKNLFWNDPIYDKASRDMILEHLIALEQPNMLISLFNQYQSSSLLKPDDQTYILLLKGAASCRSLLLTRKLHESLKMDLEISDHKAVLNTLMNTYGYLNSPLAFDIWDQVSRSRQGPSHAAVSIIIDVCSHSRSPVRGSHIWRNLERSGFRFNDNNYASYVEMCNRFGELDHALDILTRAITHPQNAAETRIEGEGVGLRSLSTLWNTAESGRRKEIADWAQRTCPDLWASLPHE